jgi:predicted nucleotidyltransferase
MARTPQKDILTRVTNLVPDALHRLQDIPGGQKMIELANESKTRIDEMQKKLRGLDALERRVAKLEQQLASQKAAAKKPASSASSGTGSSAAKKTTSSSSAAAKKPAAKKS